MSPVSEEMQAGSGTKGASVVPAGRSASGRLAFGTRENDILSGYGMVEYVPCPGNGAARSGRPVFLTLVHEKDERILRDEGLPFLRRMRLFRLTNEADRQGYRLTYAELCDLLITSVSTVKRDIAFLRKKGFIVPLRKSVKG